MPKTVKIIAASAAVMLVAGFSSYAADMAEDSYGMPTRISFAEIEARTGAIWLGGNEVDDGEDNQMLFGGAALRAGMVFDNRWIIQGDVFGELTDSRDDDSYVYGIGVAAHIARRFDTYLLGVFWRLSPHGPG